MRSRTAPGAPQPGEHSGGPRGGRGAARPGGTSHGQGRLLSEGCDLPCPMDTAKAEVARVRVPMGSSSRYTNTAGALPVPLGAAAPPSPSSQGRSGSCLPAKWHTLKPTSLLLFLGAGPTVQGCTGTGRQPSPQHRADTPVPSSRGCQESQMSTRNSPALGGRKGRCVWDLPQPRLVPGGSHSPAVGSQCPAAAGGGAVRRAKQGAARLRSSPPGQQRARQRPALLGVRTRGSQSSARLTPCWQTPALPGQHQGRSPQPQRKEEDRFWAAGQAGRAGRLGRASPSVPRAQVLFPCSCSKSTMASWERDPTPSRLLCTQRW